MADFKHVIFNPVMTFSIAAICTEQEQAGWELLRIVQSHAYESVAVFRRFHSYDATEGPGEGVPPVVVTGD